MCRAADNTVSTPYVSAAAVADAACSHAAPAQYCHSGMITDNILPEPKQHKLQTANRYLPSPRFSTVPIDHTTSRYYAVCHSFGLLVSPCVSHVHPALHDWTP